jgi:uncharacterized protein (DUF885 family)
LATTYPTPLGHDVSDPSWPRRIRPLSGRIRPQPGRTLILLAVERRRWRYPVGVGAAATAVLAALIFVGERLTTPVAPTTPAVAPVSGTDERDWIAASNRHAAVLLDIIARYEPEWATALGIEGHDEAIVDLAPQMRERRERDLAAAIATLEARRPVVVDARVKEDLDILVTAARDQLESSELSGRLLLPFSDLGQMLFFAFRALLDDRIAPERRPAALVRLRRYAGVEDGYTPVTELARARFEEHTADATRLWPWRDEVQQALDNQERYLDGIRELFLEHRLDGWQTDFERLREQFARYAEWLRDDVLPRARPDHRLPIELYRNALKSYGVRADPEQLMAEAFASYIDTRDEMDVVARAVARARGLPSANYRDVIRALQAERIPDHELLDHYRNRLTALEEIVRRERIVTLPERAAEIRLASEAESAATPAPHLDTPRMIGNTGEPAVFVLPLSNPNAKSGAAMNDFSHDAISWTLTAHEARPGHELQFARVLEHGTSVARAVFAMNSANVEGWALYAEALMKQHLPAEGQLGSLQLRLLRAARAFLDPMINLGFITPERAKRFLMDEVVLSEPMAQQEVDRYSFVSPGQATSYFYGFRRLNALRTRTEIALAERFDALDFHDFIVTQGFVPFEVLERAVLEGYVPRHRAGGTGHRMLPPVARGDAGGS